MGIKRYELSEEPWARIAAILAELDPLRDRAGRFESYDVLRVHDCRNGPGMLASPGAGPGSEPVDDP